MTDEERVSEVKAWFSDRGYELVVHEVAHGGYLAPYVPIAKKSGVAHFTWGRTAVAAAEAAQAQFESDGRSA